jgi:hypothetical protein
MHRRVCAPFAVSTACSKIRLELPFRLAVFGHENLSLKITCFENRQASLRVSHAFFPPRFQRSPLFETILGLAAQAIVLMRLQRQLRNHSGRLETRDLEARRAAEITAWGGAQRSPRYAKRDRGGRLESRRLHLQTGVKLQRSKSK